jgi:hypothetical protein
MNADMNSFVRRAFEERDGRRVGGALPERADESEDVSLAWKKNRAWRHPQSKRGSLNQSRIWAGMEKRDERLPTHANAPHEDRSSSSFLFSHFRVSRYQIGSRGRVAIFVSCSHVVGQPSTQLLILSEIMLN